jgi:hypothetical protein
MPSAGWAKIVIYLAAAIWIAILVLRGTDVQAGWLTGIGGAAGAVVVALALFDQLLWRLPGFRLLARRRVLRGTWHGKLTSTYEDPETGERKPPIEVYLVVHQTYSEISASLLTSESKSQTITANFSDPARGQCLLSGIYMNTPELLRQDRSRIHRGGMILEVSGRPASLLKGFYFTDRDTKGELIFDEYSSKLYEDFEHARRGDYVHRDGRRVEDEEEQAPRVDSPKSEARTET